MIFKEWLLLEDDDASQFFYALTLYPSDAFDGANAFNDPAEVWSMQTRWEIESRNGRKFHNIDKKEYSSKKYNSINSPTMPSVNGGFWRHRSSERPNLELKPTDLKFVGYGKTGDRKNFLSKRNKDLKFDLKNIFGDEGKDLISIDKKFDKPFKKVYEYVSPYIDVSNIPNSNTGMGIRSKYVGPDDTGEKSNEKKSVQIADFGFERKHYRPAYIKDQIGRSDVKPQEPNHHLSGKLKRRLNYAVAP